MVTKGKLYIGILLVALAAAGYIWYSNLKPRVKQGALIDWIKNGYAQQFCSVIYPRLANCLTMTPIDCPKVANTQISDCIKGSADAIPDTTDQKNAKKIYDGFRICFQNKMHAIILRNYAVDTSDCAQRLK